MPMPTERERAALHAVYQSLHQTVRNHPDIFNPGQYTAVITQLMGGRDWSWRVVGITPNALQQFQKQGFARVAGGGITRAHIVGRQATCEILIRHENALDVNSLFNLYLERDQTILCAKGENKRELPAYIDINNPEAELFSSKKIGWRHGPREIDFLGQLQQQHLAGQTAMVNPT